MKALEILKKSLMDPIARAEQQKHIFFQKSRENLTKESVICSI